MNICKKSKFFRNKPSISVIAAVLCSMGVAAAQGAELREAVEKTIINNPEVKFRWHEFRTAAEELGVGRSGFMPTIDLTNTRTKERQNEPQFQGGPQVVTDYSRNGWSLNLTQNLFQGFQTANTVKQLDFTRRAKYFEFLNATESQALEAVRAWIDVLRYRQLVEVAKDNYATHLGIYEQVQSKVTAGVGRRVDLEQAAGRLALAESNLITDTSNLNDVSTRYMRIVGEVPPPGMQPPPSFLSAIPKEQDGMAQAVKSTPSYLAALANVRAARSELNVRRGAFSPTLDLRARKELGDNLGLYDGRYDRRLLEVVFNVNLLRGGADKARLNMAAERLNSNYDLRDKECRDMRQVLTIAYNDERKLKEQLVSLRQHRLSTEKARDAYRKQFDIGQRSLLDLLDSENELFDSGRAVINAEQDEQLAQARVLGGLGILVQTLKLKPIEELADANEQDLLEVGSCNTEYLVPARVDKAAIPAKPYFAGGNLDAPPAMDAAEQKAPALKPGW